MSQIETMKRRDYAWGRRIFPETSKMIKRQALTEYLNDFLLADAFKDYGPNGLQVEGKEEIKTVITGTTACQALIDEAIGKKADAILVHHGLFWQGDNPCVVGMKKKRLKALLDHDISLFAYHLPLDAHPEIGNNAVLGDALGFETVKGLDDGKPYPVGLVGHLPQAVSLQELKDKITKVLAREPQVVGDLTSSIKTVAWCTGAAQKWIDKAAGHGVDAYISGEISEPTFHSAIEEGVAYIGAGHHATEIFGARALGEHLAKKFGLDVEFVNVLNPV